MKQAKKVLATGLLTVASLGLYSNSRAALYTEPGDAGQTLATAANAGTASLIQGTISTPSDADLYQITISAASMYTLSTLNTYTDAGPVDTELSLFSSTGTAILENDDASGKSTDSTITTTLAVGTYYIGVSSSGNEPVNSNSQLLFVGLNQSGDTTTVRGPAVGVNPTTLAGYNSNEFDTTTTGQYQIGINAVPEPSTWAAIAFGGIAAGSTFLRRRRTA